jgi:hypothetical protein
VGRDGDRRPAAVVVVLVQHVVVVVVEVAAVGDHHLETDQWLRNPARDV